MQKTFNPITDANNRLCRLFDSELVPVKYLILIGNPN